MVDRVRVARKICAVIAELLPVEHVQAAVRASCRLKKKQRTLRTAKIVDWASGQGIFLNGSSVDHYLSSFLVLKHYTGNISVVIKQGVAFQDASLMLLGEKRNHCFMPPHQSSGSRLIFFRASLLGYL